jgi:hypothetical protein
MFKKVDYIISSVRFDENHKQITHVKGIVNNRTKPPPDEQIWSKSEVIKLITSGKKFAAKIYHKGSNSYEGQKIQIVSINGIKYLKTSMNYRKKDCIGDVPRF